MNKKGAISGGVLIILLIVGVLAYTQGYLDFILKPTPEVPVGKCPSSGLTETTINTQEALAASATNSIHDYYVFDKSGVLVANGNSGSDGQSVFDVKCGVAKQYDVIVLNDTASGGFYSETFTIDASESTFVKNLKTYEYGMIDFIGVTSSVDPSGNANVSSGLGKVCSFDVTFTENESASAFNKPVIMCEANTTSVIKVSIGSLTQVNAKKPARISATSGEQYWVFEVDTLLKSTDAAQKIGGKIQFSASKTPVVQSDMTCQIVDQATFKKSDYKTLSLSEGFIEATENTETVSDIGAPDSNPSTLEFVHSSGYC